MQNYNAHFAPAVESIEIFLGMCSVTVQYPSTYHCFFVP